MDDTRSPVRLDDYSERRARRQLDNLVAEAQMHLSAVAGGDLRALYGAHHLVSRAIVIMLRHRWDAA